MAAVLLVVGGLTWLLTSGESDDRDLADPGAAQRFPVPGYVPADIDLVYGSYALSDPADPGAVQAVVARTAAEDFEDAVTINVLQSPDTTNYDRGDPVLVNGHDATLMPQDGTGTTVWWEQETVVVWVHAANADQNLALAVAESVRIADSEPFLAGILDFGELPAGFLVVAPPVLLSTEPMPVVAMEGSDVSTTRVQIEVSPESLEHVIAGIQSTTPTQIRGQEGYTFESGGIIGFVWTEAPGLTVMVSGTYSEQEVSAIAEGLDFVTEAVWNARYEIDRSAFRLPSTTTTPLRD
jgi:hypothetical protein